MSAESEIFSIAKKNWICDETVFNENLVLTIYEKQILQYGFTHKQIQALEFTQYFERYLWPNFKIGDIKFVRPFIISICSIVNEKLSEKVSPWESFVSKPEEFSSFFHKVLEMILENEKPSKKQWLEQIVLMQFLNNCFLSMTEVDLIFNEIKYLMSMGMWMSLSPSRLSEELSKNKEYKHKYGKLVKSDVRSENHVKFKRMFLPKLLDKFLGLLEDNRDSARDVLALRYAENCVLLFINLESMLVSRRYLNALLDDKHIIVRSQKCTLMLSHDDARLFSQLIEMLDMYAHFEIDEITGSTLTDSQLECRHRARLVKLQHASFAKFKEPMRELWISTCRTLEEGDNLQTMLTKQTLEDLQCLAIGLGLIPDQETPMHSKEHLVDMFCYSYKKRSSTLNRLNNLPLYPSEKLIYDENQIPDGYFSVEDNFAIPKLSVQYLSFHDYLMRNFELFRLEASYEIKQDIEQCLAMMKPIVNERNDVVFQGWSRMALAVDNFEIVEVAKPEIGRNFPRAVKADVSVILGNKEVVKNEWENLARHDPCFLITVYPKLTYDQRYSNKESMASQMKDMVVRGCEIEGLLDKDGKVIPEEERRTKVQGLQGQARTWRVKLDPCQYHNDVINDDSDTKDVYSSFNIFLRRKPKENNFKAVLETIRDLMNDHCVVPDWLQDLLLGYDQPNAAHYSAMNSSYIQKQNWVDTFLDFEHVERCFPQYRIRANNREILPPYKLSFPGPLDDKSLVPIQMHDTTSIAVEQVNDERPWLDVEPHKPLVRLAQKFTDPSRWSKFHSLSNTPLIVPGNQIPFTATQVEAIRSGMQHGLTLVVGPPGTGKTDIAVQIIHNIYRNYPNQRTLIVTHSNQALNQLFEKIMNLEIDERHLLRLGHGEEALETTKDFSKYGRVNYVLAKRLQLLYEVEKLSVSLGCIQSTGKDSDQPLYTCETSQHFLLSEVMPRWVTFQSFYTGAMTTYDEQCTYDALVMRFPFLDFFVPKVFQNETTIRQLFQGDSLQKDLECARACFKHLLDMFVQLDDFRSFELMRNGLSRANSLLVRHAKIIAMTCTHAALRRRDLIQLGFTYDNILIEEAAQILEIETFIPLLLQKPDQSNLNRLKRWVMIGDHNQLPPVIKNMVFQNYCNMSQSMFSRLIKLGVPAVQLNAQGRSRTDIVALYGWRYKSLEDLPTIRFGKEYSVANPGLLYDYQLVNVPDYLGQGESEPTPHFIQNLAEAEYCVAMYMYMRAIGYPAHKITVLTTYNGQKHLIRDIIKNRCSDMGPPDKITTVDRFQGQQNDYVILSLVRTKTVGHLRDIRRLVVALSRARLGLYIFCRTAVFTQCKELQKAFGLLMQRSTDLALVTGEHYSFVERFMAGEGSRPRMADQHPDSSCVAYMQDVQHMTQYVHTIYTSFKKTLATKRRRVEEESYMHNQEPQEKHQRLALEEGSQELCTSMEEDETAVKQGEEDSIIVDQEAEEFPSVAEEERAGINNEHAEEAEEQQELAQESIERKEGQKIGDREIEEESSMEQARVSQRAEEEHESIESRMEQAKVSQGAEEEHESIESEKVQERSDRENEEESRMEEAKVSQGAEAGQRGEETSGVVELAEEDIQTINETTATEDVKE